MGETALPRRIKAMIQLCEGDFTDTAKDLRRQEYFEANDTIVACIQDQFDQPEHTILRSLESLLMKTCKKEDHDEDLGLRQRRNSRPTVAPVRLFRCGDGRWSNAYLSRERVLSVGHPGTAITNVASGRTSPDHSRHSSNEC